MRAKRRNRRGRLWWCLGTGFEVGLSVAGTTVLAVAALRVVDPPFTPRSIFRRIVSIASHAPLPAATPQVHLRELPPELIRALLVAEDARFYQHHGFDWEEIRNVADGEEIERGASTLTMQLARNLFLWTGPLLRVPRKAGEVAITPVLEALLGKDRILELYLNWCTFSPGTIGIGEAAKATFGLAPAELGSGESIHLVACLPNPALYCGSPPSRRHAARMRWIRARMDDAGAVAPRPG